MIKLKRKQLRSKQWTKWVARCQTKTQHVIDVVDAGKRPKLTALYKKQKAAYVSLSHGKCVFCEKLIVSTQHGDIDHFRPKDAVSEEDWTDVQFCRDGRSGRHLGYYWLTYEPRNLVLACIACNQIGEGKRWGKSARFPVESYRAERPGEEANEAPCLLNPFDDNPADHLSINSAGVYAPLNASERGRATISVLGLNLRGLPDERAAKYGDTIDKMNLWLSQIDVLGPQTVVARLKKLQSSQGEFANVIRTAAKEKARAVIAVLGAGIAGDS
jgi:hypothetical protein